MANLTTVAALKANYLNIAVTETGLDAMIAVWLTNVQEIASKICGQPLVSIAVVHDWENVDGGVSYFLPYIKNAVTITSLQYRQLPSDSFTTQASPVVYKSQGLQRIYNPDNYTYTFYRANITVGFTDTTAPSDLVHIISEMVTDVMKQTPFAGGDNRFGVSSLAVSEGGTTRTTVYKDLLPRWTKLLAPWKVHSWRS